MTEYIIGYCAGTGWTSATFNAHLGAEFVNNASSMISTLLPGKNFTIRLPLVSTQFSASKGIQAAYKLIFSGEYGDNSSHIMPTVLGIVGPAMSSVAKPMALLGGVENVPFISFSATSATLSDKSTYSTFCRTVPSDDLETSVIGAFVQNFGWEQIVILSCDDDFCVDYADALVKQRFDFGYQIKLAVQFSKVNPEQDLKQALLAIRDTNVRVILSPSFSGSSRLILKYMEELGMYLEGPEAYILITPMGSDDVSIQDLVINKRGGHLSVRYKALSNDIYNNGLKAQWHSSIPSFLTKMSTGYQSSFNSNTTTIGNYLSANNGQTGFAPYAFDAVLTYAKVIYDLEKSNTPVTRSSVGSAIANIQNFSGATGPLKFTSSCDRLVEFELVNLRNDLTNDGSYSYHPVAYWKPNDNVSDIHGVVTLHDSNQIVWGTGSSTTPSHLVNTGTTIDNGLTQEAMILISIGSVIGVVAIGLFGRFIRKHLNQNKTHSRYDPNVEHKKRIRRQIIKQIFAFGLEITDYVSDALSASSVFSLFNNGVIGVGFVMAYLIIICVGGIANFGNLIARSKNFIDLFHEYSVGVSMAAADVAPEKDDEGSEVTMQSDISQLQLFGAEGEVKKLEDLTVKIAEVKRSIRIEKFTFALGLLEDLPVTIMNSILLMSYRDDIEYGVIYFSTLITLLEFGMKAMSLEKILMLKSQLLYLKQHINVQRHFSRSKISQVRQSALQKVKSEGDGNTSQTDIVINEMK